MKHRDDKDAAEGKESPAGNGSDLPEPSPFERFEEFARKVISVPKSVIDERDREARHKPIGPSRKRPA